MPLRTTASVCVGISSGPSDAKDLAHQETSVRTDVLTEGGTFRFKLANGTTDKEIVLGDTADVQLVFVRIQPTDPNAAPVPVQVKINADTAEVQNIVCLGDKKVGMYLVTTEAVTALFFTNAGATDMDVVVVFGGD